jgi:hypothetical protein
MSAAWNQLVAIRAPKAFAAGKVSGAGVYALLSCPETDGVRNMVCFWSSYERQRQLERWDRLNRCNVAGECQGDHRILDLDR